MQSRLQADLYLFWRVCEVLVAFWPDFVGQNGRRSKMANFGYTPVLALYSKTSGALIHPLESIFLKFFGIFTFFMVNVTWKTCGWLDFQKIWHLNHPKVGDHFDAFDNWLGCSQTAFSQQKVSTVRCNRNGSVTLETAQPRKPAYSKWI